ncbi:AGAP003807-PA [Anopheles gambiae str. PEST]|uniref:AGAP003807-PA n=1 Tax=Anopheles gambiae TaxID=7165 RepID=Q7QFW4_ANOGA|nr:AGAP003807-PA [Anopheles gambiae str. PEST]
MIGVTAFTFALLIGLVAASRKYTAIMKFERFAQSIFSTVNRAAVLPASGSKGGRIVGGYDATEGQFPHQVSLRRPPNFHFCGGSIIGPRWIISATHCTIGMEPANLNVYVGSVKLASGGVYYRTMRIVNHPLYDPNTIENDISLIQTVQPIVFNEHTQPIGLASTNLISATGASISGWGRSNVILDNLQYMNVNILTMEECRAERPGSGNIFDSVICVSSPFGQGACSGDSGGPLIYDGMLHGIASFVRVPCATEVSDVYERVYSHLSWIASVTLWLR